MEFNAALTYCMSNNFFAVACHVLQLVVSYRWLIDNRKNRAFQNPFIYGTSSRLVGRQLSLSRSIPTTCNLYYMEWDTKGEHSTWHDRGKNSKYCRLETVHEGHCIISRIYLFLTYILRWTEWKLCHHSLILRITCIRPYPVTIAAYI